MHVIAWLFFSEERTPVLEGEYNIVAWEENGSRVRIKQAPCDEKYTGKYLCELYKMINSSSKILSTLLTLYGESIKVTRVHG